jgi:hypothetical protein
VKIKKNERNQKDKEEKRSGKLLNKDRTEKNRG